MSDTKYLQLETELKPYAPLMDQTSDSILDQEVSKYPIFVAHQHDLAIGVPIAVANAANKWNIHASTLEEFVSKQIVQEEKIDEFRKAFKDPLEFYCLFVLSELGANFIFLPRVGKSQKN